MPSRPSSRCVSDSLEDRPPSPGRKREEPKAAAKPKAAYRPPGARGGGLAEQLRKELGSTAADSASTATKAGLLTRKRCQSHPNDLINT